jgi:hypothetical protein
MPIFRRHAYLVVSRFGPRRMSQIRDCVAERSEFELPVPLSKLSHNSLMLSFATSRRVVKQLHQWLTRRSAA